MRLTAIQPEAMVEVAPRLFNGLGSLWTRYFEEKEYPESVSRGHALSAAQLCLDILELIDVRNKDRIPLFHRERWRPATILLSQRGLGSKVRVGELGQVGTQTGSDLVEGSTLSIGGGFDYSKAVAYPIDVGELVATTISDGIANPEFVLASGSDFSVRDGAVYFRRDKDPFELGFPFRELDDGDREVLLWCSDCLDDNNWLNRVAGRLFGAEFKSTERDLAVAQALWDIVNRGSIEGLVFKFLSAVFGQPVSSAQDETVEDVGLGTVVTDVGAYRVSESAGLVVGSGDLLPPYSGFTDAIRMYTPAAVGRAGSEFRLDVPAIALTPGLTGLGIRDAVSAVWSESELRWVGTDRNGNPKFEFDLYGGSADVETFFREFHANCEAAGVSQAEVFASELYETWYPSPVVPAGAIVPALWFVARLMPGCLGFAVADLDVVGGDTGRIGLLRRVLPVRMLMSAVGKRSVSDTAGFDDVEEDTELGAADLVRDDGPGVASERVFAKWVAVCG